MKAIAETVSNLPLSVYKYDGDTPKPAKDHYISCFLNDEPNEMMTWIELRESMTRIFHCTQSRCDVWHLSR